MANLNEELLLNKEDGVAILTLNRPDKLNALSSAMFDGIEAIIKEVNKEDEVKVLIITGAGRAFCAGADVGGRLLSRIGQEETARTRRQQLESAMLTLAPAIMNLRKPLIAAVNGVCVGAGLSLAALCDIRIASELARFGAIWVRRGLIPDVGATYILPRIVGFDRALELMFTGDIIDAKEAERIGLVTRVAPHDDLMKVTKELAFRLAKGPSVAIELTKRIVYSGFRQEMEAQLNAEAYGQMICFQSEDFKEGVQAFAEKREPIFRGM